MMVNEISTATTLQFLTIYGLGTMRKLNFTVTVLLGYLKGDQLSRPVQLIVNMIRTPENSFLFVICKRSPGALVMEDERTKLLKPSPRTPSLIIILLPEPGSVH